MNYGREPITLVEIDQPFCTRTYGTAPCAAVLGTTGSHKCFNTRSTCQDSANYDGDGLAVPYLSLPGVAGNNAGSPDSAASRIVGDIDIRAKVALTDWTPAVLNVIFSKRNGSTPATACYVFGVNSGGGTLLLFWSDGVSQFIINSTVAPTVVDGATLWVRATLDVDNGAAGNTVVFYTSADGVTWTQLGAAVVTAGVTSIRAGSDTLEIGTQVANTLSPLNGKVFYVEVRNGIAGTVVVKFDPPANDAAYNAPSFVSDTLERWTIATSGGTPAKLISPLLRLRFAKSQTGALDLGPAIPSLVDLNTRAAAINLAGMDESASALGTREQVTMKFDDHQHSDLLVDRYRLERPTGAASLIESGTASAYGALSFDGTDRHVDLPVGLNAILDAAAWSVEFGFKTGSTASFTILGDRATLRQREIAWNVWGAGAGSNTIAFAEENVIALNSTAVLSLNTNYLVTLTYGNGILQFFVNGAPSGSPVTWTASGNATGQQSIGEKNPPGASGYLNGIVDEFRVYSRQLTAEECAAHFAGSYENESGLFIYLPFEEQSGATAIDMSGNGNNGTLINTPARVGQVIKYPRKNVLKLRSAASAVDDFYNGKYARIDSGTGSVQTRQVIDYDALSKLATLDRAWGENYIQWSEDPLGNWGVGDPVNPFTAASGDIKAPDGSAPAKWTLIQTAGVNRSFAPSVAAMPAIPGSTVCFSFWVYIPSTNSNNPFSFYAFATGDIPTGEFVNLNKLTRNTWQLVSFVHTWGPGASGNLVPQFHPNAAETLGDTMYVWRPSLRYGTSRGEYVRTLGAPALAPDGASVYSVFEAAYSPLTRGTMWGKWLARNPYYNAYRCRVYQGYAGDLISAMRRRVYILDSIDGPDNGAVTVIAKDLFSLVEAQKSVAPLASLGELLADITAVAGTAQLSPAGIGNSNYPASGNVAIGDEIITFTRVGDVLTLTVRGALNTVAAAHKAEDLVQVVLSYVAQLAHNILYDLLLNYTALEATDLPLADWTVEAAALTQVYTGRIATPTPVADLIGELAQQVGFSVWPDVSSGQIFFAALRAAVPAGTLDDNGAIIVDSLKIKRQTERRASQVWMYYGQIAANRALDVKENYHSRLVSGDLASEGPTQFGTPAIREVFSRWIPQFGRQAAQACGERIVAMFKVPPLQAEFRLKATDAIVSLARYFYLSAAEVQDEVGLILPATMAAVEIERGEMELSVTAQEVTFATPTVGPTERVIYIENDSLNLNLRTVHDSLYAVPVGTETVRFIVVSGVTVGSSSTANYAIDTGTWPAGVALKLDTNGGRVQGRGGDGAQGGNWSGNPIAAASGATGGDAIHAQYAISIDNLGGEIWAGGGGGGGGSSCDNDPGPGGTIRLAGGGGGGGAGTNGGTGGAAGTGSANNNIAAPQAGGTGTRNAAGGGGGGAVANLGSLTNAGTGGAGGGPGLAGSGGGGCSGASAQQIAAAGSGAAAGRYIVGNSFVTWVNNGDRRGGVA